MKDYQTLIYIVIAVIIFVVIVAISIKAKKKNQKKSESETSAKIETSSEIDFDLKEAEIRHDEKGLPFYHLTGRLAEKTDGEIFLLSISHDGGIAAAVCIRESAVS